MATLSTVYTFFVNKDAHAAFLHRVEAAIVKAALDVRNEEEPEPMTESFRSRQRWAVLALAGPTLAARAMLPALAILANNAELISEAGEITATDSQIESTVASLVDECSDYIPESA
jgi:hypothetical protein